MWSASQQQSLNVLGLDYFLPVPTTECDNEAIYSVQGERGGYDVGFVVPADLTTADRQFIENIQFFIKNLDRACCVIQKAHLTLEPHLGATEVMAEIQPRWLVCFGDEMARDFVGLMNGGKLIKTLTLEQLRMNPLQKQQVLLDVRPIAI